ncbi:MAG: hypothetical protein EYX74_01955 [Desulfobulbaceae bacterium]|nr:MAG: hypothetical protein EYX74_01955 [Desulfobulbaceae bacterium]
MMKIPEGSELAEDLRETRKAAGVARDLVRQILAFSRHDPGNPAPVEVHIVVKEVLKLLRSSIPTTIEIRQNIDPHGGYVLTNPTQIHQILMNLCINAHHAMQKTGGILGVVLVPLEISSRDFIKNINLKPGPYLRLEISDTGMGMDSATLNRIFEPYFTTKDKGEGTGMGLAVVHGLVKGLGGHITVYSELKKGTTFHVYLPVIKSSVSLGGDLIEDPVPTGAESILLIDDDEDGAGGGQGDTLRPGI